MSKGPGVLQRKLLSYFRRNGYGAAVTELCQCAHELWPYEVEISHRKTVIRAVKALAQSGYPLSTMESARMGCELIVYKTNSANSRKVAEELCKPFSARERRRSDAQLVGPVRRLRTGCRGDGIGMSSARRI
jgi:hypothetical protein